MTKRKSNLLAAGLTIFLVLGAAMQGIALAREIGSSFANDVQVGVELRDIEATTLGDGVKQESIFDLGHPEQFGNEAEELGYTPGSEDLTEPGETTQPGEPIAQEQETPGAEDPDGMVDLKDRGGSEQPEDPKNRIDPEEPEELVDLEEPQEPEEPEDPEKAEETEVPVDVPSAEEPPAVQVSQFVEPRLAVAVYATSGKAVYEAGDMVNLTITLRNSGNVDLSDIGVSVPLAGNEYMIPFLTPREETVLETGFAIPYYFHMGYIGVGAYAQCQYEESLVSGQGASLVVVDEQVSNPDMKEVDLEPLLQDWQSVVPLDVIPDSTDGMYEEPDGVLRICRGATLPSPVQLSNYSDSIEVSKTSERSQGCRAYRVTLGITGTPPPAKPVDVVLVIDRSGSMGSGSGSSMYYAKEAAKQFVQQVLEANPDNRVAVVSFSGPSTSFGWGAQSNARTDQDFTQILSLVEGKIDGLSAGGGTNTQSGFIQAGNLMQASGSLNANKAIVFLTDGVATASNGKKYGPSEPTQHNIHTIAAYTAGQSCHDIAQVFTVNLLKDVPQKCLSVARDTMQRAQNAGYYETESAVNLSGIYSQISQQLNYSATNAVVTDKISNDFVLVEGSFESSTPEGTVAYDEALGIITWMAGTIVNEASMSYVIRAKAEYDGSNGQEVPTNDWAKLNYSDVNDQPQEKQFPVPTVVVPPPLTVNAGENRDVPLGASTQLGGDPTAIGGTPLESPDPYDYNYHWTCDTSDWESNESNPVVSPAENTGYTVTVTDNYGCIDSDTVQLTVLKGSITVTKTVTPGGSTTKKFTIYVEGEDGRVWSMRLAHGESATIFGLKANNYTCAIREVVPMDYTLMSITGFTMSDAKVTITGGSLNHQVTVTNKKVNDYWFRDDDEAVNSFNVRFWNHLQQPNQRDSHKITIEALLPEAPVAVLGSEPGGEASDEDQPHDGN